MRIDGRTDPIYRITQKLCTPGGRDSARGDTPALQSSDQVTLSSRAQAIRRMYQALTSVPTERAERIAALREAVQSGSYEIPEDALAARLIGVIYPER
ncbi:MAG TPA: flagellar biosynthesis anti-sigma factor FlgM [Chloroflexi bacterium]|mgnify:CR=1 FL=1|jgi:flagellar biosynthesis anti-sigma factor FlgM|nr:flagellar biosynthesis anti-sigma factor FlgM [Chloroflexota bacterium]